MPAAAAVAIVGSAAISASAQSKAAKKAANAQVTAADEATDLQRAIYQDQRALLTPSIAAGAQAQARRMLMQGIPAADVKRYLQSTTSALALPAPGAESASPSGARFQPMGGLIRGGARQRDMDAMEAASNFTGAASGASGPLIDAGPDDYAWVDDWNWQSSSPSYDFRFDEGQRALERSAAARGRLFSGATGRELTRYGQDFASQEFENDFRRFGSLAGEGSDNADTVVNVAGQYGDSAAANARAAGDARASGYINQGNIAGNFWGNVIPGAIGTGWGYGQQKWGWG